MLYTIDKKMDNTFISSLFYQDQAELFIELDVKTVKRVLFF